MQKIIETANFDWSRDKTVNIKRGGINLLVSSRLSANSSTEVKSRPRCIWPSVMETSDSKYFSRRVWGR